MAYPNERTWAPQSAQENSLKSHETLIDNLNRRIDQLKNRKTNVLKELSDLHQSTRNAMSSLNVHGYILSDFFLESDVSRTEKVYHAQWKDSFNISVAVYKDKITRIDVAIDPTSPLMEIKEDLQRLTAKRCPRTILMTVQQFSQMERFRETVLYQQVETKGRYFQVHSPDQERDFCSITAYVGINKPVMHVQWTMVWDRTYCSLVHSFKKLSEPAACTIIPKEVLDFCEDLTVKQFHCNDEVSLNRLWEKFCNWIITVRWSN